MKTALVTAFLVALLAVSAGTASAQTQPSPPPTSAGTPTMTPTEKNAQLALEKAGYQNVKDVKSGPKGIAAKATKNGKQVSVLVDPEGKIEELP
ncbi:MAG TPA: PepSY domain-containing protein [Vineibacter sp.]|nr:PepSY domain-containing protein [Vineibacter sp.]